MAAAVRLRDDFDAARLRGLAKASRDPDQLRRLLSLAEICDGGSRGYAARIRGVGLQTVRDWVLRFNAGGPEGLIDPKPPGKAPKLDKAQRRALVQCHRWAAHQLRLFLHTGAYWLLHQLRQAAPRRSLWRKATFETLRRAILKIAVRIEDLKSRIKIALPSAYPYQQVLISIACLGAVPVRATLTRFPFGQQYHLVFSQ